MIDKSEIEWDDHCFVCNHDYGSHSDHLSGLCIEFKCKCEGFKITRPLADLLTEFRELLNSD